MKLEDLPAERFAIEHQVRSGGMGQVFRGRDRATDRPVAIKVIADDREHRVQRFAREVEVLSELSHPGIVRYVSHGVTASGKLFLAMEWLDGEDLGRRLEREPLTMGESVALAARVADALGAAHARGIVHRDLKPSNLFLPDGRIDEVKVLDFGIALQEGKTQLTQTGTMIGTPGYMAPEQARSHGAIDARADVFALGCVLFQCLTGSPAFEGDSAIAVLGKILFDEAPRLSALWPEVPEELDALVAQMLAKDPALRPADGKNLAAAIAALGPSVHSAAIAPRTRPMLPSALTGSERRFLSVVLLGPATDDMVAGDALRRALRPFGGRMEQLADGSTIVVLAADRPTERTVATDQAAQAARCALAIRALARRRAMAVAMGRVESSLTLPEGEVIARASQLLADVAGATVAGSDGALPIALDDITAGLLDARFDVTETDAGLVLHGERALSQGARTLLGRPTSCVGRDWELNALTAILDACADEPEARVVIITAAAGMGKSRLAAEFIARLSRRGDRVATWVGRGDSLRAGSTLDLLGQVLRSALGVAAGEPLEARHDRIRARVAEHVPAADQIRVTEFLGELVGAPFPGDGDAGGSLRAARRDARVMSEQMHRAWIDFLDAETAAHPVLLVLEDLHWGDFGTVRFIDTALRDRRDRPWMVLALARPEVFEVFPRLWAERQNVQEIRLKELGRRAGERLIRQVLGDSVGADTMEHLVEIADGNAFYLEELIRASAEGKDQGKDRGKDRALPETVLAMVETRLARLAIEARRVLRAASVFGEVCWEGGVVVLLGGAMSQALVAESLTRLAEQEVLAVRPDSRLPGEREYRFRHSLLREGAYATLTADDKRLGHRLAGAWLDQHGEADPMVLAGHFERGGDGPRAAGHYLRAAEQAFHVFDIDATMARAALGLACAPPPELRLALLAQRCEASGYALHRIDAATADAEELMRTAPRGSVPWAQGMGAYHERLMLAGRISDLVASTEALRDIDLAPAAVGRVALSYLGTICALDTVGMLAEATAIERQFDAFVRARGDSEPIARFWWHIALGMRASYAHEDPWTGLVNSDAIQPIYELLRGERIFLNMEMFRGQSRWYLGAFAQAAQILESIPAADESLGIASSLRRLSLAWLCADRGALDQARTVATAMIDHGRIHHSALEEGRGHWVLAEALRRLGDLDGADREIATALPMAMPLERPGVLGTLSVLRRAQGRTGDARVAAEDAIARCREMGGCGMFRGAFVRLAHAEALHATGAHDEARRAIAEARTQLHAIADRIADPAHRKSFLDEVPENAATLALARAWLDDPPAIS